MASKIYVVYILVMSSMTTIFKQNTLILWTCMSYMKHFKFFCKMYLDMQKHCIFWFKYFVIFFSCKIYRACFQSRTKNLAFLPCLQLFMNTGTIFFLTFNFTVYVNVMICLSPTSTFLRWGNMTLIAGTNNFIHELLCICG